MNNDELQKAIDDITKSDAGGAAEGASENDALVDEMVKAGMPTTGEAPSLAPITGATEAAGAAEPVAPEMAAVPEIKIPEIGAMPPVEEKAEAPVAAVEAAAVAPEVSTTVPEVPVTEPATAEVSTPEIGAPKADLEKIEKEALKELYPLLNKVDLPAEEKFDICMKVAKEDKDAIAGAFDAAKEIADETKRAEALVKILEGIK
ncbi:hypothetical protein IJG21_00495 [Candidatus Saccharibacteria bacterium]|nr:hypothetical protein [Candidatus Saccharibacteria bacterium]